MCLCVLMTRLFGVTVVFVAGSAIFCFDISVAGVCSFVLMCFYFEIFLE